MLRENKLVRTGAVLGAIAILLVSICCAQRVALADETIHFANGGTATLKSNGNIEGICHLTISCYGGEYAANIGSVSVKMPDGQTLGPDGLPEDTCMHYAWAPPASGDWPFVATKKSNGKYDVEVFGTAAYYGGSGGNIQPIGNLDEWDPDWTGKVKVTKKSANTTVTNNNSNYEALTKAEFTVYDDDGHSKGKIKYIDGEWQWLELEAGSYTMKETKVPSGYKTPDPNSKSFTLKSGDEKKIDWVNEPKIPKVYIKKTGTTGKSAVDALIAANPNDYDLAGAEFTLYKSKNINDRAVDANGNPFTLTISKQTDGSYATNTVKVPAGTYYIRETKGSNKGFARDTDGDGIADNKDPDDNDNWPSITLPADEETHYITWNNPPLLPKVQVNKTGTTGNDWLDNRVANNPYYDLNGAEFTLYTSKNQTEAARAIDANGNKFTLKVTKQSDGSYKTNIAEMVAGTYYVRETKAANSGYQIDTDGDGICDNEDSNPTDYWYSIKLPADENVHSISWNNPPFFPEVDLTKYTSKADMNLFEGVKDNPCYDILGAQFTLMETDGSTTLDINGVPVVFTVNSSEEHGTVGKTNKFKILPGDYWLRETKAPNKGFRLDADGDGRADEDEELSGSDTSGHKNITVGLADQTFTWTDPPMYDPAPLYLRKYDSKTGRYFDIPEGSADLNGAQYRVSYYKGIYTRADQLPSTPDTTAVWTTHSYTLSDGRVISGAISLGVDSPTSGTWKYNNGGGNYAPLGTLAIQEIAAPTGYLIDPVVHLVSLTDDGTHMNDNILRTPYNRDGTVGNDDWNNFFNQYQLNGDRSGAEVWF